MKFLTVVFLLVSVFCFSQKIDCPVENGVTYYSESYEFRTKRDCWNIYEGSNPSKSTNVHSEKPISVISISEGKVYSIIFTGNLLSILVRKGDNEFYVYRHLRHILRGRLARMEIAIDERPREEHGEDKAD